MAIEVEHRILMTDVLDLGPDVPPEIKLWDNCIKYLSKKKGAKMISYYKKKTLS